MASLERSRVVDGLEAYRSTSAAERDLPEHARSMGGLGAMRTTKHFGEDDV